MKQLVKRLSQAMLGKFGYRIVDERNVHDEKALVERLKTAGFSPKTVVDVGVAHGTPYLYEGFPHAKFMLFDPTKESLPYMREWSKEIDADIFNFGLGSNNSNVKIKTRETIQHATLLTDVTNPDTEGEYEVEVKTFDSLSLSWQRPCLVKVDVEGFELEVLKGMVQSASDIDIFIIETSLASLYDGGPDAMDIIAYMRDLNFREVDIAGITRRPRDAMIHQIDFVFANLDTKFAAKAWT